MFAILWHILCDSSLSFGAADSETALLVKLGRTGSSLLFVDLLARGTFGKSFVKILRLSFFCSGSLFPSSDCQLFFFLVGDGLVNLVLLPALQSLFSPLWDLWVLISVPASTSFLFKKSLKLTFFYLTLSGLLRSGEELASGLFSWVVSVPCL